jgi:hypothetical protein
MKKYLATIMGIVVTLFIAIGAFAWGFTSKDNSSYHRARTLQSRCYEERAVATGAPVTQQFPECRRFYDAHLSGSSERMTSSAISGVAIGAGFALFYFGGRWFLRRRSARPAAGG